MASDGGNKGDLSADRRAHARLALEMWVEEITDGARVFRRAGNMSRGGLYLDQTIPIPVGSTVNLRFTLPDDANPITVTGTVVSVSANETLGMGVKFVNVSEADQRSIDAYLDRRLTPLEMPIT